MNHSYGEEDEYDPIADALSREHLEAIGYLTAAASMLESALAEMIHFCLELNDERGEIITAQLMFQARTHMLGTLLSRMPNSPDKTELQRIYDGLDAIKRDRNAIVHASWRSRDHNNRATVRRVSARGKLTTTLSSFTPSQIMDMARTADYAYRDLVIWLNNAAASRFLKNWEEKRNERANKQGRPQDGLS
jgi:hypothetical protein